VCRKEEAGKSWPVESRVGEVCEDISTAVPNVLSAELGTAPAAEQGENKMQSSYFS
jgi:hypothetical protein